MPREDEQTVATGVLARPADQAETAGTARVAMRLRIRRRRPARADRPRGRAGAVHVGLRTCSGGRAAPGVLAGVKRAEMPADGRGTPAVQYRLRPMRHLFGA